MFDHAATAVIGANGSGKTSFLEAIYFLVRGRSFRQPRNDRLVRHGAQQFRLYGEFQHQNRISKVGLEAGKGQTRIRINGEDHPNLASLNRDFVVEVIEPEIHQLISDGPEGRRRFLDYGVFHVEPEYLPAWQRYRKALKQRNAALKSGQSLNVWDQALTESAAVVDSFRQGYVALMNEPVEEICAALNLDGIRIDYRAGWDDALSMQEALAESLERDRKLGITHVGPHRADLKIDWHGRLAKSQVSRGQQKLLASALILAQTQHLATLNGGNALLLVDDPAAELDKQSLERVMAVIRRLPGQLILSAIDRQSLAQIPELDLFHVEHGVISHG